MKPLVVDRATMKIVISKYISHGERHRLSLRLIHDIPSIYAAAIFSEQIKLHKFHNKIIFSVCQVLGLTTLQT